MTHDERQKLTSFARKMKTKMIIYEKKTYIHKLIKKYINSVTVICKFI
jgi:hypothetical protein